MNTGRDGRDREPTVEPSSIRWAVRESGDRVRAIADVPESIPQEELGYVANDSEAALFIGTPRHFQRTVTLPSTVEPTPISVSYNNGVFELVFARAPAVVD